MRGDEASGEKDGDYSGRKNITSLVFISVILGREELVGEVWMGVFPRVGGIMFTRVTVIL